MGVIDTNNMFMYMRLTWSTALRVTLRTRDATCIARLSASVHTRHTSRVDPPAVPPQAQLVGRGLARHVHRRTDAQLRVACSVDVARRGQPRHALAVALLLPRLVLGLGLLVLGWLRMNAVSSIH